MNRDSGPAEDVHWYIPLASPLNISICASLLLILLTRKDVLDCQWIQQLHSYGLLSAGFQPEDMIRTLRGDMRHRRNLTQAYSTQILHMQKTFEQLNVKLHNVITDLTGKLGQLIIRAIIAGERDPERLVLLASGRVSATTRYGSTWVRS